MSKVTNLGLDANGVADEVGNGYHPAICCFRGLWWKRSGAHCNFHAGPYRYADRRYGGSQPDSN